MQNKRDQLLAYRFMVHRLSGAVLRGEADAPQPPLRRSSAGTFGGAILAVLIVVGLAVFGLIVPGGNAGWQQADSIIVVKETGGRFLYAGGVLRPVLNYASALLVTGTKGHVVSVSENSLHDVPHGAPIGIPGAPEAVPSAGQLTPGPWLVCTHNVPDTTGVTHPKTVLAIGATAPTTGLPADNALVVQSSGSTYVAWHDHRYRVSGPADLVALGYGGVRPVTVAPQWLNALSQGADLAPPVTDTGSPGPAIEGDQTRIGQVFVVQNLGTSPGYYVLTRRGLTPVTQTQAELQLGDPVSANAYAGRTPSATPLSPADAAALVVAAAPPDPNAFPDTPPKPYQVPDDGSQALCAQLTFGSPQGPAVRLALVDPARLGGAGGGPAADPDIADQVVVAPGGGVLARALPAPGVPTGTLYLITDLGTKFPLPSADVANALGYSGITPTPIPTLTLALLPTGPSLDPSAAAVVQAPAPVSSPSPSPSPSPTPSSATASASASASSSPDSASAATTSPASPTAPGSPTP